MNATEKAASEMMVSVSRWQDLEVFGVNVLTGEACAFGLRLLCDVNVRGLEHVTSFFGLEASSGFHEPRGPRHFEPVASVMLPKDAFVSFALHVLAREGFKEAVWVEGKEVAATREPESEVWKAVCEYWAEWCRVHRDSSRRVFKNMGSKTGNVHTMWGFEQG